MNAQAATLDGLHVRALAFHPVRSAYVGDVVDRTDLTPAGSQALVVGCGQGLVARDLARLGFAVTGVDSAPDAIHQAEEATASEGLTVDYEVGDPTGLSHPDGAFDLAYYADTFEITSALDQVVAEAGRVLRPGGVLVYDTVNRTQLSRLIYLGALQSWRWSRVMPRGQYAWDRLRPPDQLTQALAAHNLRNREMRGFLPGSPRRLLQVILRARRGQIEEHEVAELGGMHLGPEGKVGPVTYVGYAVRQD